LSLNANLGDTKRGKKPTQNSINTRRIDQFNDICGNMYNHGDNELEVGFVLRNNLQPEVITHR
jgi:hypothetical protein